MNFAGPLLAGIAYAYLTYVFGSVWPAVLAHAVNNLYYMFVLWITDTYAAFGIWNYFAAINGLALLLFLYLSLRVIIFMIIVIPIGNYLYHIASGQRTFADPVFDRVDGGIFKVCGIHPDKGMNWKQYALALLLTNAVMVFVGYLVLRIQFLPIFNPNGIGAMEETLSFNTIISFMTNTNLQHYSGESGLSYLSQMLVITYMMFVSAATGYAACIAFVRGLAGKSKDNVGNFYADLVKVTTRVLIPLSIIGGMLLIWQGVPQNFDP